MTPRERRTGIALSIGLLLQLIFINGILKNVVRRPRPYDEIDLLTSLIGKMPDSSFPSGHTTASFLSATIIYMCMKDKRYGIMAYIIAILIALSRLYLGVHYPSDVIAGVIFGVIIGFVVSKIASLHKKSRKH
ncbi:MAG: phosphatase PAP2 family protein [Lachnospiraceae bacterium]|nr:phosphatase PAP2 family protein [Lachnospiraceae bacterium]